MKIKTETVTFLLARLARPAMEFVGSIQLTQTNISSVSNPHLDSHNP